MTTTTNAPELPALLLRADTALGGGDGKAALLALGEALIASGVDDGFTPIVTRILDVHKQAPGEVETAVSLLARAEERFGAKREIVEARALVHESAGHHEAAFAALQRLAAILPDDTAKAVVWEKMGDIARTHLGQPQQALIQYQAAFKSDRKNRTAVRKAAKIYLEQSREEQAKQLVDLELEQAEENGGADAALKKELAELYIKIGEALLVRPNAHAIAKDAVDRAAKLAPDLARARTLKGELEAFPTTWKDHVRRLRDAALDARDKRDAAKRYLAIAQVYSAYAPKDPQIEQNVEKCLLLSPGYRPALKFLEALYREEGKLGDFIERLKKQAEAVRAVDVAVDMWLFVALLLAERGAGPDEIAGAYEKVRRVDPRNVAAIHALTELHLENGRYDKAAVVMEAFLSETSDVNARKNTLRQLARLYEVEIKDLTKAAERLEQLRTLDAEDEGVTAQLADVYERRGDEAKLADVLEAQLRHARRREPAAEAKLLERLMAIYQGSLAAPDKAFNAGRRLFVLQPRESLETELQRLADALARTGDLAQTYLDAANRAPAVGEARRLKIRATQLALQAGDRKRARALIDSLLEMDASDKDALALLDSLLAKDASPEEHAAVLESRVKTQNDPRERAQTLLTLADVLAKLHKHDDAVARLQQVLEIDAGLRAAHEKLEAVLRSQERWEELAAALERRVRVENDLGNANEASAASLRLAKIYDEKLDRADDAAGLFLRAYTDAATTATNGAQPDAELLRALERLQAKGALVVPIAEALQPYYAQVEQWRKHVEMMAVRHQNETDSKKRALLAKAMASVLEEKLKSPREAFDAWADAFVDEPSNNDTLAELDRLSQVANAHARFADVLQKASERLPEGPGKQGLLQRRADLLQGVLGDQVAAIEAHRGILSRDPGALSSLDALAEIYAKRDSWTELKDILEKRIQVASPVDAPVWCAKLGSLLVERFNDLSAARAPLEGAFAGEGAAGKKGALTGEVRKTAIEHLVAVYKKETEDGVADVDTVEKLAWALGELAGTLAGKERSAVRAELGDTLRALERWREALQAYEAALANDDGQERALNGIRAILDENKAPVQERNACARALLGRYDAAENHAGRAHVLEVMLKLETNAQARRALVGQLTSALVEQLDLPDEALDALLLHLEADPEDDPARRQAEALAAALQRYEELFKTYQALRVSPHEETALLYSERLAELTVQRGDIDGGLEALRFLANLQPTAKEPWERMASLYERRNDAAGVASCLEKIASLVEGPERLARLFELSDYYFDTVNDDVRGLDLLRTCHEMAPKDDAILARLEGRLRLMHADTPELAGVVEKRAALQTSPALKAALLLEHGLLLMRVGELQGAVRSLLECLRVERDGNSTARCTDALQKIATRDDQAGRDALDAIIEHHRAQKAWQPLVESLEIAATKREAGEERARLLDDISQMHETALRVPQLAFMATCRALRDSPSPERLLRVKALAEETGSYSDLLEVLEDVAEANAAKDVSIAIGFLQEAAGIAEKLDDKPGQVRVAEAIMKLDPSNAAALNLLERIHRGKADQQALVEVLRRRVASSSDAQVRRDSLLEMAKLLVVADDNAAEAALRQALTENPKDVAALKLLDDIYERIGNSAGLVDVLNARIALEGLVENRVLLRTRLGVLKLKRRGDPAGALDELAAAVNEAPHVVEVRHALEVLVDHARSRGAPPIADAAQLLEQTLRAQNDIAAVPPVIEMRLSAEPDHATRAMLLLEIGQIQEKLNQQSIAFMTICRAVKEVPDDASLRNEAERLAQVTDNLEGLAGVYEEVLDTVRDPQVRVWMHKRIAQISEDVGGDPETARERLVAAVQAGADDAATLRDLVRLTRMQGNNEELSSILLHLAQAAMREGLADIAKEAWAELCDVDENLNRIDGAIQAARELLGLDADDAGAAATLERLLARAERWPELAEHLRWQSERAKTPDDRGNILARLIYIELERMRDFAGALRALMHLAETNPQAEAVTALGTRALLLLSGDARPEAKAWRADLAVLLEPRFEAANAWGELASVLRLRLDVATDTKERKRLFVRIVDIEERALDRPEQAMVTLARALGEDPADVSLRERAERLSVRLHDLESLLGLYEDLIEQLAINNPQRFNYALRTGELYEGGVGQPLRAADFYDLAFQAATAQQMPAAERLKILERIERLYRAIGEPQKLAQTLKRKAELAPDAANARQFLFEAATIETHGLQDYGAAITTLSRLLEVSPNDTAALRALADACERQGRWDKVAEALDRELVALGTSDPERALTARFKLGVVLDQHLSLPDDALVQFQAILTEHPGHRETQEYLESRLEQRHTGKFDGAVILTQSYERSGNWQGAVEVLQQQIPDLERRGDRKEIRTQLLRIADMQEQKLNAPDLAFGTLCRALKNDPNDPNLRDRLNRLAVQAEVVEELAEMYEDEALGADVAGRSTLAAELREAAASLYAGPMKDVERAIKSYEGVLEKQPGRLVPLEALSELYPKVGRFADLEKALRRRLMFKDEAQERVPILVELAAVLADKIDRPEDSIPLLEEARRLDPGNVPARRLLIELRDAEGESSYGELRALLNEEIANCKALGDVDGFSRYRLRLAVLLADQIKDVNDAIPLWEELRSLDRAPKANDQSFVTLEKLYNAAERYNDLRSLYETSLKTERDPSLLSSLTTKLGDVLSIHLGSKDEAVSRHLKILELDPQNQASLNALRKLYWDLGKYEELVALIRRMMRTTAHAEQLKDLRFQLAEVLGQKLAKRAESVETGRRILDIEPHSPQQLERLAAIFKTAEAWDELADVLERASALVDGVERVGKLIDLANVFEENLGRAELAAGPYERILQVDGRHDRAYRRLCSIYAENNDWQKLVALKEERTRRAQSPDERIELLKEIGSIYDEKLSQKSLAFLAACRAFKENYDDASLAAWMDKLAQETDSVDEVVSIYDDALGHLSDERRIIDTHLRMAELAWKNLSSPADAELHYKRALEYEATNKGALDGMVALYESQGKWREVVNVFERRVEQSNDIAPRIEMLRRVARTLDDKAKDVDGAINAYKRILELDGKDGGALRDLAEILEREQRWQQLINILKRHEEVAESRDDKLAIRYRVGGLWEQELNNPEQAIAVYRSILDEEPGHVLSLKALERLFTTLNRPQELVNVFEKMLKGAPTKEEAVRLLFKIGATWEESLEDSAMAVDANQRVLQADADNVRAVENLERLHRARGEWDQLVKAYETHISLTRDPAEIVSLYLAIGQVYAQELGRTDKAEQMYNAALDFDPGSQDAIHSLGALYEKSGNWFNALEKLQAEAQLLGASKEAVEIYHRIGNINEQMLLDVGNAVFAYKAALDIEPSHLPSVQAMKNIALQKNDNTDYLHWLRQEAKYTEDEAKQTEIHTTTGLFLQDTLADLEGASEELEKALALTFDHLAAAKPLADIAFRDENWQRAEQLLDIIVERLDPNTEGQDLCRQHYRLGYVCEKLGKDAKALKNYQRAYEIDATYLPALEGLGAALSKGGRWDDAAKIYQAILIHHRDGLTDAEVVDYYQQLADLNHKLGQSDRAIKSLEKALELDANHGPSLRLMANVLVSEQRFEDAYEVLIRLVPLVFGDERTNLLIEIGRLAKGELDDPYRAIDAYEDANRQRPADKEILESMLQLYRQTRQGPRAVEVLEELVRVEQDQDARVRLNQTLGEVYRDEIKNEQRAVQYFNAALDLDPNFVKAFESIESLLSSSSNWAGLEENYISMLKRIPDTRAGIKQVLWKNLGDLYRFRLRNLEGATQAYRVIVKMQSNNAEAVEVLADLLARNPQAIDDAAGCWARLIQLNPDKIDRALHELVRLALAKKNVDRAYVFAQSLKVLAQAAPNELEILQMYAKQVPAQAKRAMTDKLWEALLVHPAARGPIASISAALWRSAGSALALQPKDFGIGLRRTDMERVDLDAPVQPYFINQLKHVRGVLATGAFELYQKTNSGDPLYPLCLEQPTLALGKASTLLSETQGRRLWFTIGRQLTALRPAYMLPRTLGAQRFNTLIDVAVKFVDPRYQARGEPGEIDRFEKALARFGQPLVNGLRPHVAELMKTKQAVSTKAFLEGMEHTAIRAGYLLTGDLELCMSLLKQPDPGAIPLAHGAKVKELLLFAVSDENFELRQRLGTGIGS